MTVEWSVRYKKGQCSSVGLFRCCFPLFRIILASLGCVSQGEGGEG